MPTGNSRSVGVRNDKDIISSGPFSMRRRFRSYCLQRSLPTTSFASEVIDFQTLPTPAIEKYHPSSQLIHSFPKYWTIVYSPSSAADPIIGNIHASLDDMRSGMSSSSSSSSSSRRLHCSAAIGFLGFVGREANAPQYIEILARPSSPAYEEIRSQSTSPIWLLRSVESDGERVINQP